MFLLFFFFNDTATTEIYTLSLHDALPICEERRPAHDPLLRGRPALLLFARRCSARLLEGRLARRLRRSRGRNFGGRLFLWAESAGIHSRTHRLDSGSRRRRAGRNIHQRRGVAPLEGFRRPDRGSGAPPAEGRPGVRLLLWPLVRRI